MQTVRVGWRRGAVLAGVAAMVGVMVLAACNDSAGVPESTDQGTNTAVTVAIDGDAVLDRQQIDCRKARIAARRAPRLEYVWVALGISLGEAQNITVLQATMAEQCGRSDFDEAMATYDRLIEVATAAAVDLGSHVGLEPPEAVLYVESRLVEAAHLLAEQCQTDDVSGSLRASEQDFESSLDDVALGACGGDAQEGAASSGVAGALAGLDVPFQNEVAACMDDFFDSVERYPPEQCSPLASGDGEGETSDDDVDEGEDGTIRYEDEDGDEHVQTQTTTESDGETKTTTTDVTCDGACQFDDDGTITNEKARTTVIITTNENTDRVYVIIVSKPAEGDGVIMGRPIVDGVDPVDSSTSARDAAIKEWEDCIFGPGTGCGDRPGHGQQDCLISDINPEVGVRYLVPGGGGAPSGEPEDRFPASAIDAMEHCSCLAAQAKLSSLDLLGLLTEQCGTDEEQTRMACLLNPYGPDDAPRPECIQSATVDLSALAQLSPQCQLIQCAEPNTLGMLSVGGALECGCFGDRFFDMALADLQNPACSQIRCEEGRVCTCDGGICGCSDPSYFPVGPDFPTPTVPGP